MTVASESTERATLNLQAMLLPLLLLGYFVIGVGYVLRTPAWQAPDEPAHYNYIAQVAEDGCCPVIAPGDWSQAYLSQLTSNRFAPDLLSALPALEYEDHQPPLYYLLAAPIFRLTNGNLTALRLFTLVIGVGVVWVTFAIGRGLLPSRPQVALGGAMFVAFLPQHLAMNTAVNNDALIELLIGLTLLMTIRSLKGNISRSLLEPPLGGIAVVMVLFGLVFHSIRLPFSGYYVLLFGVVIALTLLALNGVYTGHIERATLLTLGLLLGMIFVTKATGYFLAGVVALAVIIKTTPPLNPLPVNGEGTLKALPDTMISHAAGGEGDRKRRIKDVIRVLALLLIPALILGGVWWARNLMTYDVPDFLGLARHDLVVDDQLRTADLIDEIGTGAYLQRYLMTTYQSFWGQFGWMALPLPGWIYWIFTTLLLIALSGLGVERFVLPHDNTDSAPGQGLAWRVLALTLILGAAQFIYYNLEFAQLQGRYLFPALIPMGVWLALGLDGWRRLIFGTVREGGFLWAYAGVGVLVILVPINLYLLWRVIPGLAP
jgi:hypothetical protein